MKSARLFGGQVRETLYAGTLPQPRHLLIQMYRA
jgi:hypothetical protein